MLARSQESTGRPPDLEYSRNKLTSVCLFLCVCVTVQSFEIDIDSSSPSDGRDLLRHARLSTIGAILCIGTIQISMADNSSYLGRKSGCFHAKKTHHQQCPKMVKIDMGRELVNPIYHHRNHHRNLLLIQTPL